MHKIYFSLILEVNQRKNCFKNRVFKSLYQIEILWINYMHIERLA